MLAHSYVHTTTANDNHFYACRQWQEHYQNALNPIGANVVGPKPGQRVSDYRRESCQSFADSFLPQTNQFAKMNWPNMPLDILTNFEPQLLASCVDAVYDPRLVPPGEEFRAIQVKDDTGRTTETRFVGPESFVKRMGREGRHGYIRNPDTHPGWFPKEIPSEALSFKLLRQLFPGLSGLLAR